MQYLNRPDYKEKYFKLWETCRDEFFKLEVLPVYEEFDISDWSTVDARKTNELICKVQKSIYSSKEKFHSRIFNDGVHFNRIRYIPFPLSKYLLIELSSYMTSQSIGVNIEVIEDSDLPKIDEKLRHLFSDFVLFDEKHLFKFDNPGGIMTGGAYYSDQVDEIAPYIQLSNSLKTMSKSLNEYLSLLNIQFINSISDESQP
ncbi:MAG: DUF6879 family protein [Mucilaginibacter sp.]|uniref:DUF6879 family protein n=1 Tax=Mucilaginibacter sp. TaxID=1882438 RepID=UPI003265C59D